MCEEQTLNKEAYPDTKEESCGVTVWKDGLRTGHPCNGKKREYFLFYRLVSEPCHKQVSVETVKM